MLKLSLRRRLIYTYIHLYTLTVPNMRHFFVILEYITEGSELSWSSIYRFLSVLVNYLDKLCLSPSLKLLFHHLDTTSSEGLIPCPITWLVTYEQR